MISTRRSSKSSDTRLLFVSLFYFFDPRATAGELADAGGGGCGNGSCDEGGVGMACRCVGFLLGRMRRNAK
jgi:hypothetical protein